MYTLIERRLTIKLNIKKKKHKKKNEQKPFFPSLNHKNQDVNVGPVLLGEENYLFHPVNIYSLVKNGIILVDMYLYQGYFKIQSLLQKLFELNEVELFSTCENFR